jgi:hypothetical protein
MHSSDDGVACECGCVVVQLVLSGTFSPLAVIHRVAGRTAHLTTPDGGASLAAVWNPSTTLVRLLLTQQQGSLAGHPS